MVTPNPKSGSIGNLPMFKGTLNGLSMSGFTYRNKITDKFIIANVMITAKTTIFATTTMFPTKANATDVAKIPITAIHGVPVFECILPKTDGNDPSLAIPYSILAPATRVMRTVLAVAKSAITDRVIPPSNPKPFVATSAKGADDWLKSSQSRIRTEDNETRM